MLVAHLTSPPGRFAGRTIRIKVYSPLALLRPPTCSRRFFRMWPISCFSALVNPSSFRGRHYGNHNHTNIFAITLFLSSIMFLFCALTNRRYQRSVASIRRRWELSQSHLLIHYSTHPIVLFPMSATGGVSRAGTGGRVHLSRRFSS